MIPPSDWSPVEPSRLNKESIAKLATNLIAKTNYVAGGSLLEVVKQLGGKVSTYLEGLSGAGVDYTFDPSCDGDIRISGFRDFEIRLSPFTGALRNRFSIAHELGHYVLHFLYPTQIEKKSLGRIMAYRMGGDLAEQEANWFAANFLMPETEFRKQYAAHRRHTLIAQHFEVSTSVVYYRAKGLDLEQ